MKGKLIYKFIPLIGSLLIIAVTSKLAMMNDDWSDFLVQSFFWGGPAVVFTPLIIAAYGGRVKWFQSVLFFLKACGIYFLVFYLSMLSYGILLFFLPPIGAIFLVYVTSKSYGFKANPLSYWLLTAMFLTAPVLGFVADSIHGNPDYIYSLHIFVWWIIYSIAFVFAEERPAHEGI